MRASSHGLLAWAKRPPLFPGRIGAAYLGIDIPMSSVNHSKSGLIVNETNGSLYHLYFGDSFFYDTTSPDLVIWTALPAKEYFAAPLISWEYRLIGPGPVPIKTRDGW